MQLTEVTSEQPYLLVCNLLPILGAVDDFFSALLPDLLAQETDVR